MPPTHIHLLQEIYTRNMMSVKKFDSLFFNFQEAPSPPINLLNEKQKKKLLDTERKLIRETITKYLTDEEKIQQKTNHKKFLIYYRKGGKTVAERWNIQFRYNEELQKELHSLKFHIPIDY